MENGGEWDAGCEDGMRVDWSDSTGLKVGIGRSNSIAHSRSLSSSSSSLGSSPSGSGLRDGSGV